MQVSDPQESIKSSIHWSLNQSSRNHNPYRSSHHSPDHSSLHSPPVNILLHSNGSGNRIIITPKISHCRVKYIISPEKDTLNRQITVSSTQINTINRSNNQSNQSHKQTNKSNNTRLYLRWNTSGTCFAIYPTQRVKFTPLKCNFTPLLVPNVKVFSSLVGISYQNICDYPELSARLVNELISYQNEFIISTA